MLYYYQLTEGEAGSNILEIGSLNKATNIIYIPMRPDIQYSNAGELANNKLR